MSSIPAIKHLMVTVIAVAALSMTAAHAQSNTIDQEAGDASKQQLQQLLNLFANADINDDGFVTETELDEAVKKPFNKMDRDGNERVNSLNKLAWHAIERYRNGC